MAYKTETYSISPEAHLMRFLCRLELPTVGAVLPFTLITPNV